MHDFTDFSSEKFYNILTQQRQSVSPCKHNFENFAIRGRFSQKLQNCFRIFRSCDFMPS